MLQPANPVLELIGAVARCLQLRTFALRRLRIFSNKEAAHPAPNRKDQKSIRPKEATKLRLCSVFMLY